MTVNIPEVLALNLSGAVMILFLLLVRIRHYDSREPLNQSARANCEGVLRPGEAQKRRNTLCIPSFCNEARAHKAPQGTEAAFVQRFPRHTSERLFNGMLLSTLIALIAETASFLLDGKVFPGSVFLLFLTNSLCTGLTVTVGFLWCLFVNSHIYCNSKLLARKAATLCIPLAVIYVLLIVNLFGNGILFQIQEDGVYVRGHINFLLYLFLGVYFIESIAEVHISRKKGVSLFFFPVYYFVVPCIIGTAIQGLCYGLATGWFATAMACVFVSIELQTGNAFLDGTSGLFNRDYMNYYLKRAAHIGANLYGIMIDINDFKSINDTFGHAVGDRAISEIGRILSRAVSRDSVAMRMSGDEFVVFINNGSEQKLDTQKREIEANLRRFNEAGTAPFQLSVSVGTAALSGKTVEQFLSEMDYSMYEAKRAYHKIHDRRSSRSNAQADGRNGVC